MRAFVVGLGLSFLGTVATFAACAATGGEPTSAGTAGAGGAVGAGGGGAGAAPVVDDDDAPIDFDAGKNDSGLDPDAACGAVSEETVTAPLPVDIIWMVDNSVSMAPAITEVQAGLNAFAELIAASDLDYKVILLSLRGTSPTGGRYPLCVPPPLGDGSCGNGPRFFHASVDVLSTQTLEQFLGTYGQTNGYKHGEARGGEPWAQALRPEATKTIVMVTDDNARLAALDFETFPGGTNPFNSLSLPPGILHPSQGGVFDDYLFSAIYGWGSNTDPGQKCSYPNNSQPPSSGWTYSTLILKTGGVRAKICDGSAAWGPFFSAVAQAVLATSKLLCSVDIPEPEMGEIEPSFVNVQVTVGDESEPLYKVAGAQACDETGGWYYDDDDDPAKVILCPTSCSKVQDDVGPGKPGKLEILFGCQTIVK